MHHLTDSNVVHINEQMPLSYIRTLIFHSYFLMKHSHPIPAFTTFSLALTQILTNTVSQSPTQILNIKPNPNLTWYFSGLGVYYECLREQ